MSKLSHTHPLLVIPVQASDTPHTCFAEKCMCQGQGIGTSGFRLMTRPYPYGRFREAETLRFVFEQVLQSCSDAGLVGGEGFAVDPLQTLGIRRNSSLTILRAGSRSHS
jgi:hypothetical protein